jgi:hypothetical protein
VGRLEELLPSASVSGILPNWRFTVVTVRRCGSEAIELTFKDPPGRVACQLLYWHDEPRLEVAFRGRQWSFDGAGHVLGTSLRPGFGVPYLASSD